MATRDGGAGATGRPTIDNLAGIAVSNTAPIDGDAFVYDGAAQQWDPTYAGWSILAAGGYSSVVTKSGLEPSITQGSFTFDPGFIQWLFFAYRTTPIQPLEGNTVRPIWLETTLLLLTGGVTDGDPGADVIIDWTAFLSTLGTNPQLDGQGLVGSGARGVSTPLWLTASSATETTLTDTTGASFGASVTIVAGDYLQFNIAGLLYVAA